MTDSRRASPQIQPVRPWYREPWPWLLMAGPAVVVAAGFVTAWIAVQYEDGLVADDYYRQGLAINQMIGRDAAAAAQNVRAQVMFGETGVRVFLSGPAKLPGELGMQLVHPTRAGLDRKVRLVLQGEGWYEGALPKVDGSRWHVIVEDGERNWRLSGDWAGDGQESLQLVARTPKGEER